MGLLTVDEFIRSGRLPMVKNKHDVYMLIRMGGLRAIKQGRRTYIVTDNSDIDSISQNKEERNKKIHIRIPEMVYKLIAVVADKKNVEVEQYIDEFLDDLSGMFRFFSENNQKIKEIEISRIQMEKIVENAELIQKIDSFNENKRFQGRRVNKYLVMFIFLLTLYCYIKFEQKI